MSLRVPESLSSDKGRSREGGLGTPGSGVSGVGGDCLCELASTSSGVIALEYMVGTGVKYFNIMSIKNKTICIIHIDKPLTCYPVKILGSPVSSYAPSLELSSTHFGPQALLHRSDEQFNESYYQRILWYKRLV